MAQPKAGHTSHKPCPFALDEYELSAKQNREDEYELSAEQWAEIERRRKDYKSGKGKTQTLEETKKMMRSTLKK